MARFEWKCLDCGSGGNNPKDAEYHTHAPRIEDLMAEEAGRIMGKAVRVRESCANRHWYELEMQREREGFWVVLGAINAIQARENILQDTRAIARSAHILFK